MADTSRDLGPISVVICNYNGEAYLAECLAAVATLRGPLDEVLLVDNASTDGSLELVRTRHPEVRVIELDVNAGPSPARNAGMRAARNRWVLALDNDVLVAADTLEKLSAAAAAQPGAALVQPRSVFGSDRERVHYDGGGFHYVGLFTLRNFYRLLREAEGQGTVEVDGAVSLALLVDRDLILKIGGYDAAYFILFEDLDLSYRLRVRGHRILSVEDAIVTHLGGTPGISYREGSHYPSTRAFLHSRNRWLYLIQNYRLWTLLVALPGILVYELVWLLFVLRSGHLWPYLRGKLALFRLLPHAVRRRRLLSGQRKVGDSALLVGGPLTITPSLTEADSRARLLRFFDRIIHGWWSLAGRVAR